MNPTVNRDQLEHEARAQIIWGDDPDTVLNHLRMNGFADDEAVAFVEGVLRERLAVVRGVGFRQMMMGIGLIAIPAVAWLMMNNAGVISIKLLGITGVFGLWGAWKVLQGSLMMLFPSAEQGDLTEHSD
jgi:hypothetical protein